MIRFFPSPQLGLSIALGFLLASANEPARAASEPFDEVSAGARFELIPADLAAELPLELRRPSTAPSNAEALGLAAARGSHKVRLRWTVREHGGLSGYRVTLVAADGLPGHLAARWWVAPTTGVPVGDGLTAYSAELSLALDEAAPIAAAVEAVDGRGRAVLLGVRRSVAESEPAPRQTRSARDASLSATATALLANRLAPTARAATSSPAFYLSLVAAPPVAPSASSFSSLESGGAVSPRGPPTETITA